MELSVLASGSSGNCFYIENNRKGILIDAGISCRQIVSRLNSVGKSAENINAIFVTHEHSDHVRGIDVFSREFNVPVFATRKTSENLLVNANLMNFIKDDETVKIGGMKIEAFSKSHKACNPISFNVETGKRIGIITDAGFACGNIIESVKNADFLCMESNHDLEMLENGRYPYFLKRWIRSDVGHLSNLQASLCVLEHASSKLKDIVLCHLSKNNNTPQLALKSFQLLKERMDLKSRVFVSEREHPTEIFRV